VSFSAAAAAAAAAAWAVATHIQSARMGERASDSRRSISPIRRRWRRANDAAKITAESLRSVRRMASRIRKREAMGAGASERG